MSRTARGAQGEASTDGVNVVRTNPADIDADATVRHYDQLSERGRRAVAEAAAGLDSTVRVPDLAPGDVVRFTDYYVVR
ncbi:hypothetical protein NDI76_13160 [Halogeometricum sp. S1BR25-6]|uniref:DUF7979 domain-containing protein n=1 Tax=Halogeometricum salsisoli TaxID=2950536 RepID=A0ABU2GH11_9EURY|nr:hypothetical protein [Halogeometricum sp. S1BR25-6]MDS0299691.1 hypothetical protein [Halogeometricum sp. S1BR25-6]